MRKTLILLFVALLALPACTRRVEVGSDPNPNPARMMDAAGPMGAYDFTAQAGGQTITGIMNYTRAGGAYGGTVSINGQPGEATIESVEVDGMDVTLQLQTPDGPASMDLDFAGAYDSFTGIVYIGSQAVDIRGARRQ